MNRHGGNLDVEMNSWDVHEATSNGELIVVVNRRSVEAYTRAQIPRALGRPNRTDDADSMGSLQRSPTYVCDCDRIGCNASTKTALTLAMLGSEGCEFIGGFDWCNRDRYATEGGVPPTGQRPMELAHLTARSNHGAIGGCSSRDVCDKEGEGEVVERRQFEAMLPVATGKGSSDCVRQDHAIPGAFGDLAHLQWKVPEHCHSEAVAVDDESYQQHCRQKVRLVTRGSIGRFGSDKGLDTRRVVSHNASAACDNPGLARHLSPRLVRIGACSTCLRANRPSVTYYSWEFAQARGEEL